MGEKSPLHGYWVLMDQYTDYWIRSKKATDPYSIDISTCEEDCIPLPKRPNCLDLFHKNSMWAQDHPDLWKYDLEVFRLKSDLETLSVQRRLFVRNMVWSLTRLCQSM